MDLAQGDEARVVVVQGVPELSGVARLATVAAKEAAFPSRSASFTVQGVGQIYQFFIQTYIHLKVREICKSQEIKRFGHAFSMKMKCEILINVDEDLRGKDFFKRDVRELRKEKRKGILYHGSNRCYAHLLASALATVDSRQHTLGTMKTHENSTVLVKHEKT